jgi:hypothetical protein
MSYSPDQLDEFRRAAGYVDRILRGANPGELPVQEPTKFELVVNLKTSKALGINIPPTLLARAGRNPNWEILRWSGYPPKGFNSTMIMKHPKIAELRKKFVFKETLPM